MGEMDRLWVILFPLEGGKFVESTVENLFSSRFPDVGKGISFKSWCIFFVISINATPKLLLYFQDVLILLVILHSQSCFQDILTDS